MDNPEGNLPNKNGIMNLHIRWPVPYVREMSHGNYKGILILQTIDPNRSHLCTIATSVLDFPIEAFNSTPNVLIHRFPLVKFYNKTHGHLKTLNHKAKHDRMKKKCLQKEKEESVMKGLLLFEKFKTISHLKRLFHSTL